MTAIFRYIVFILLVGVVFYGVFNETAPPRFMGMSDKIGHMLAFAALSFCGLVVLPKRYLAWFVAAILVLAVGSEFVQDWLLPYRQFAVLDLLANLAGASAALCVWLLGLLFKRFKA